MATRNPEKEVGSGRIVISPPNFQVCEFTLVGEVPYVQNQFSKKAKDEIRRRQEMGSTGKKGEKKPPRDYEKEYQESMHISTEGWRGIPAGAFRSAMVSACRTVGFKMTLAKLSVFVEADGFDALDGTPLVRITKGDPHMCIHHVRIGTTTTLAVRSMWDPGWQAKVRIKFDGDQFTMEDVANLMMRVGAQVGIGEGRPDSRMSTGMGWGIFDVDQVVAFGSEP